VLTDGAQTLRARRDAPHRLRRFAAGAAVRRRATTVRIVLNAPTGGAIMFTNESGLDRAFRVVVGIVLLGLVFVGPKTLWGLVGLVPLVTGVVGFCPLYRLLNLRTNRLPPRAGSGLA
jgi:hypothetical protein